MAKTGSKPAGNEYIALPAGSIDDPDAYEDDRTDEERSFDEFITGLGAEKMGELRVGKLKVAKDGSPLANARSAHCFSCPIDQFNFSELLEYIRTRHGAGLFRVVGITSGKRGVAFNKIIEIAEDRGPAATSQDSPLQNPNNLFESVAKIMAESQARTEQLIARLSANPVAPPDPMDMMTKMAGLFATIIGVAPKPAASDDMLGQLEKLAKIKELLAGFGGNDNGASESNFFDVVKTSIQAFAPALAHLAVRNAQNAPALAPPEMPPSVQRPLTPHNKQPGPTRRQENNGDPAMANFKRQVDTLVQNAKMGVDPMQLAGTILDLTPDDKIDALGTMLDAPDMIEKMAALNPEVNVHRPFFEKLRAALLSLLDESEPDTLPADTPSTGPVAGESGATGS